MKNEAIQAIGDQIRDIQGFCRINYRNFSEGDQMRHVFGDICQNLESVLRNLRELHEGINRPSSPTESGRVLNLIQ